MIFQDPQSSLNERAKVSYIVGEGLQNVRPDLSTAQQEEKVRQALLDVGLLPEFASRFPPRIFRRTAPAHRHCPGPDRGAGVHRCR